MTIDALLQTFCSHKNATAIVWQGQSFSYQFILQSIYEWQQVFKNAQIAKGAIVAIESDFSPQTVALLLASITQNHIVVPILNRNPQITKTNMCRIAQVEYLFIIHQEQWQIKRFVCQAIHPLLSVIRERQHPGLIVFSSGSSGEPKAAVHDFLLFLSRYQKCSKTFKMLNFLVWDHVGGTNTLLHTLTNHGTVYLVDDHRPHTICENIEKHRIEILPVSPTFLNLLLVSKTYREYDLSSLKMITYGTEPMPQKTLQQLNKEFPHVSIKQTYGLIELGVFRSRSKGADSLWIQLDVPHRVVNHTLQIKTSSAMIGYLNAPAPFTSDGWFDTGDVVEVDGEYLRILGRKSERISIAGEKVFPQEVENCILQMENVQEVMVYKQKNPLVGNILCAKILLQQKESKHDFTIQLKQHCKKHLQKFKIPTKIQLVCDSLISVRGKKIRV